jgi:hypothetical protein
VTSAGPGAGDGTGLRVTELPRSSRQSRPRHLWLGLLLLGGLAVLLGGLSAWQLGAVQPGSTPLGQLRQRLGIGPATPASAPPAPVQPPPPPAPARPSAPSGAVPSGPARALVLAPAPSPAPVAGTPAPPAQFVVEFGPFPTATDVERAERQLTQAGLPTTRVREQTGASLYAVLIERMPAGRDARTLAAVLREQGFADAAVIRRDPPAVRLGAPVALRGAVALAERARGLGHPVRVAAEPGEAIAYVIRHGRFASREEAETRAEELGRFGLSQQVIRVR